MYNISSHAHNVQSSDHPCFNPVHEIQHPTIASVMRTSNSYSDKVDWKLSDYDWRALEEMKA